MLKQNFMIVPHEKYLGMFQNADKSQDAFV